MLVIACEVVKQDNRACDAGDGNQQQGGQNDNEQAGVCAFYFAEGEAFGGEVDGEFFCLYGDFRNDGSFNVLGFCEGFRLP
ncbi:hypothetical protein [Kingella oralis]|uniref:hypothetical protein n=1 Tax=Kingella oralis TaxID=505 RepID=UPI003C700FC0